MKARPISFGPKHDRLKQRRRVAAPGQRKSRERELVHYVASTLAPGIWRAFEKKRGRA